MSMESSDFGDRDYSDGRTKQSFKDSCDINRIVRRAAKAGTLSHLQKYPEPVYGEFDGTDLLEAHGRIQRARKIFDDLPSEVKREFNQDAFAFVEFAGNPENNHRLKEILPALARPGDFYPNPVKRTDVPTQADIDSANERGAQAEVTRTDPATRS